MRAFGPMNKASNVIAMTCENHRLRKSQEVDLFIQRLVCLRFKTSPCWEERTPRRGRKEDALIHEHSHRPANSLPTFLTSCLRHFWGWWHTGTATQVKESQLLLASRDQHPGSSAPSRQVLWFSASQHIAQTTCQVCLTWYCQAEAASRPAPVAPSNTAARMIHESSNGNNHCLFLHFQISRGDCKTGSE